jgi:acyl-coenzyme A thioesterase 13
MVTSISIETVSAKDFWEFSGVSRGLKVTYIRPIPMGVTILLECVVVSVSRRMANITCTVRDKATGKILATVEHEKAALGEQVVPKI